MGNDAKWLKICTTGWSKHANCSKKFFLYFFTDVLPVLVNVRCVADVCRVITEPGRTFLMLIQCDES